MKISSFATNLAVFLAGVGTTRALSLSKRQSIAGLSQQCTSALEGILSNQDASTCLNVKGLIGAVTLGSNSSAVPVVNAWLEGVCAAQPCSNATINAIASNITTGCQSDIGSADSSIGTVIQDLPSIYPTLREILCLKSSTNDTLCVSNTLLGFQDQQGSPLSLSTATGTISQIVGQATNSTLPSSLLCTDCNRRALEIVVQNDPAIGSNPTFQSTISSQCGKDFLSAPSPTDVVEGTGTAAPTGTLPAHLLSNSGNNTTNAAGTVLAGVFTSTTVALFAGLYTVLA